MSKSIEKMNLKEFIEYFEEISCIVGVDFDDNNLVTRTLHFLKEYEGTAAVKTYTQEELNEAITKALNDMNTVLSTKEKKIKLYKEALKEAFEELKVYKKALELACDEVTRITMNHWCDLNCKKCKYSNECVCAPETIINNYLKKAREQNNDTQT